MSIKLRIRIIKSHNTTDNYNNSNGVTKEGDPIDKYKQLSTMYCVRIGLAYVVLENTAVMNCEHVMD